MPGLKRLYPEILELARHPRAVRILFFINMAEASILPIPHDLMFGAMSLARREKIWYYAAVSSAGSLLGGIIGYYIGYALWDACSGFFFAHVINREVFDKFRLAAQEHAFWSIIAVGFTPIPFKIFTITSGVCHVPFWTFLLASALGRTSRFYFVGYCISKFGPGFNAVMERYFDWILLAAAAGAALAVWLL